MSEQKDKEERTVGGLGLFSKDRQGTRSVARALEDQVVGSLFNQIDTGIQHPVDFIPRDLFNQCTNRIFGSTEGAIACV